ncbi:MAG: potassium channel family protein [Propionibacteriaceae bacterium]
MTVEKWEHRSDVPLMLLAIAFLVAYAWPIVDPTLDGLIIKRLEVVSWAVWVAFLVDLGIRLFLAQDRKNYALKHWYDFALVVLPLLRPLRLLRLLTLIRILDRAMSRTLAGRTTVYVGGTAVAAICLGGLAVLDAERSAAGANITNLGDALWWATTTVTTVGYGDRYPVTLEGRLIAVVLMMVGIGVVGTVTASLASWFMQRVQSESMSTELSPTTQDHGEHTAI